MFLIIIINQIIHFQILNIKIMFYNNQILNYVLVIFNYKFYQIILIIMSYIIDMYQ